MGLHQVRVVAVQDGGNDKQMPMSVMVKVANRVSNRLGENRYNKRRDDSLMD